VQIRPYAVIYQVMEDLRSAMEGSCSSPRMSEKTVATVECGPRSGSRFGTIAGSYVIADGMFLRGAMRGLVREGKIVYARPIASFRRFQ